MHFAIWFPASPEIHDTQQSLAAAMVDRGLSDLADGFDFRALSHQGTPGYLIHWRGPNRPGLGNVHACDWIPAVAQAELEPGRYHCIIPPSCSPEDLQRPVTFPGRFVSLADGRPWLIPVFDRLPVTVGWQTDGSLRWEPVRIYERQVVNVEYRRQLDRWKQEMLRADERTEVDFLELRDFCFRSLQINYRITPEFVDHRDLLTSDNMNEILLVAIGAYDARSLRGLRKGAANE